MPDFSDKCVWFEERIELYVDGELEGPDLESFERHLDSCASCRDELSLARAVTNELRSLPTLECPDRVVEEAAARVAPQPAGGWSERLRDRFGGWGVLVPRPAMAAMLLIIVAASVLVVSQHPFNGASDEALTEQEVELAKLDVQLAFAYLGKYSRRSGKILKEDVIQDRVVKPLGKTIAEPMYPFPRDD